MTINFIGSVSAPADLALEIIQTWAGVEESRHRVKNGDTCSLVVHGSKTLILREVLAVAELGIHVGEQRHGDLEVAELQPQGMRVRKRADVVLFATQMTTAGSILTDRGNEMPFVPGDWVLRTHDGQRWPVSDLYLRENYELADGMAAAAAATGPVRALDGAAEQLPALACPRCGAKTEEEAANMCKPGEDDCPMVNVDDWAEALRMYGEQRDLEPGDFEPGTLTETGREDVDHG